MGTLQILTSQPAIVDTQYLKSLKTKIKNVKKASGWVSEAQVIKLSEHMVGSEKWQQKQKSQQHKKEFRLFHWYGALQV